MYTSVGGVSQTLEVLPLDAEPFSLSMPFPLGTFSYRPDDKELFASVLFNVGRRDTQSSPRLDIARI
jgi:hypothetical protein